MMKYPAYLESHLSEIEETISKWPVEKSLQEVMSWILQFESSDYDIALRIIKNLNVVGPDDLNAALQIAYSKLLRHSRLKESKITVENTIFMSIGSDGKSGAMIAYNFRMINKLSSARFFSADTIELIKKGNIKNVVLVDDIIATGDQSSEQVKTIAEKVRKLGIQNVYVVSAFGFKKGIDKVSSTQVADVFSAVEYDDVDTVESVDGIFYNGLSYSKRNEYKDKLINSYNGKNYGEIGALIAFYYNTPNCCVGSIWKSDNGWLPLFPRMFDGKDQKPELYELDKLIEQNVEKDKDSKSQMIECSIYVEGKTMELFFSEIAERNNHFGYKSLSVVSIGPFYSSSLVNALKMHSSTAWFVTDEPAESQTQHAQNIKTAVDDGSIERIHKIMEYFDIDKIKNSERFKSVIDMSIFDEEMTRESRNQLLEMKLFKPQYRIENMHELMENCQNEERIKELVETFKKP